MKSKILLVLALMVLTTGCTTQKFTINQEVMQESLLVRPQEELPHDYGTTGEEWLRLSRDWGSIYHECRIRLNGLIDAIEVNE